MTDLIAQASKLQAFGPQAGLMVTLYNYSRVLIQVTVEQVQVRDDCLRLLVRLSIF